VSRGLRREGYSIDAVADGGEGLRLATSDQYDLVILDLLMPGVDGMAVLRVIVARKPQQAIMVLSALGGTHSKVECLEMVAQDYLAKPFSFDELSARIRARLRDAAKVHPMHLAVGRLKLDLVRHVADSGAGPVALADREFRLLEELMRSPGQTISKERLLSTVWGYHFDPGSNVVDVYVRRLRAKLGGPTVVTVRGQGYRIDGS